MTTLLIDVPAEITPEQRHVLKDSIGFVVREVLAVDVAVSIDNLGLPIDPSQQEA